MKTGPWLAHAVPLRLRLLLLVAGPLLVALLTGLGLAGNLFGVAHGVDAEQRGEELRLAFRELLEQAGGIADTALERSLAAAARHAESGPLSARLEGVGLLDAEHRFTNWTGTPVEPGPLLTTADPPRWLIRLDGARTRLVAQSGPDEEGRRALASFVVDGRLAADAFEHLLPAGLLAGIALDVAFQDSLAGRDPGADPPGGPAFFGRDADPGLDARIELSSPDGIPLAVAQLHAVSPEILRTGRLRAGRAWAALLFPLLLALLFDWRALSSRPRGCLLTLFAIALCRVVLLPLRAPAQLLPKELGTATVFGSTEGAGLISSPADLLLTAIALFLVALALRNGCRAAAARFRRTSLFSLLAAGAVFSGAALWLCRVVTRNATVPVLQEPGLTGWNAPSMLVLGVSLVILGAGLLFGTCWRIARGVPLDRRWRLAPVPAGVAVLVVAAACSLSAQRLHARLGLERLSSEFAPQVLEQSARRSLALSSAVRAVGERYLRRDWEGPPESSRRSFAAYYFWVTGDLLLSGYQSSLDLYSPDNESLSHFGFDLPQFEEELRPSLQAPGELVFRDEETYDPAAPVQQKLLHAELTVEREGQVLGVVVGHVLDEYENLPFLPSSQPYLAALGPGAPYAAGDPFSRKLQYVLFDERGNVRVSSLVQPPGLTPQLRRDVRAGGTLRLRTGDHGYFGLALPDEGRIHLLLLPARGFFEHIASSTRMAMIPLLVLALLTLLRLVLPPNGLAFLLRRVRESFRRKLLAALLAASVLPLVGLALFLQGYVEQRGDATLVESATHFVSAAARQLEAYAAYSADDSASGLAQIDDWVVHWLRGVVGQDIHVYDHGVLRASSKRELFDSGLVPLRLDGAVQRRLVLEGRPSLVVWSHIGPSRFPVAYAPVRGPAAEDDLVVAVPIVMEQRQIAQSVNELVELILLSTLLLVGLLSIAAGYVSRTVARPVRELVGATARIAAGDYTARLEPRTRDEIAGLVRGFNSMADSLAAQRADLERRREYMERLLRHATTGVISTDARGIIVTLNPAAITLLGAAGSRPRIGAGLVDALSATGALEPLAERLRSRPPLPGEPEEVDLELHGKPHRYRLMRVDLPDPSGDAIGRLVLLDDVTDLMRSNQLAAWAEMARAIAHEIKNPLTPIQLSTEHLRRLLHDRGLLPDEAVEACLETVIKQVRTLYQIAGEFSAYAKLPDLALRPTDPTAFLRTTIGPYRAAASAGIRIDEQYEETGPAPIDEKVLARALVNLIENALHAMPDGGELVLGARRDPERPGVILSVADTGPGLDPEVRKRLFDPYFSTKSSGTGLGLAIAKRAVEAHHGTIEVVSEKGRGTTFNIRLPLAEVG